VKAERQWTRTENRDKKEKSKEVKKHASGDFSQWFLSFNGKSRRRGEERERKDM